MRTIAMAAVAATLALGAGCASRQVARAERAVASALISNEQEEQLGQEVHKELEKEGLKYVTDPNVTGYIEELSRPILQNAKRERPDVRWHLHVVDSPEVNAFATPGGHLYIQSGLIKAARSEAELAGVIAHEAGHVVGRHAARNMVQAYGLQTIAAVALGQNPSALKQIAAAVIANGTLLHHSRSQETEADEYGARFARRSNYDPNGLISFFQTLQQQQGKMPGILTWFSTHPATGDRISHLQSYIAQNKLSGGQQNPLGRLAAVQQALGGATGGTGR